MLADLQRIEAEPTPTGDLWYKSSREKNILISPEGEALLYQRPKVARLLDLPDFPAQYHWFNTGWYGDCVTRERLGLWKPDYLAVKRFNRSNGFINGIDQFQAMRVLQSHGIPCASPYIATERILISRWVYGEEAWIHYPSFEEYLSSLNEIIDSLKSQGVWKKEWNFDSNPRNFFYANSTDKNPINQFISIDPIDGQLLTEV